MENYCNDMACFKKSEAAMHIISHNFLNYKDNYKEKICLTL